MNGFSKSVVRLLFLGTIIFRSGFASAQEPHTASALPESGPVLRNAPQPLLYFDVTGRQSAVFGKQNGQFEAWIYPIKLLHNFRLEFQPEGELQPIRGENLLRQIITRPESTTLVYVHPNFSVREIIWTPLNVPAVVLYFDVESSKPLDITAAFVPDFKPMWPASFGGQHSSWLAKQKALVLTDATETPAALIGSPALGAYSEFSDHQLSAGEKLLRMRFTPGGPRSILAPLVMALSLESEAKSTAVYEDVLSRSAELFQQRVEHHKQFLARTFSFESPSSELNQDFLWAELSLGSGWVCHPRYGCGLVAGYGPSTLPVSPNYNSPANPFQSLDFWRLNSNDLKIVLIP